MNSYFSSLTAEQSNPECTYQPQCDRRHYFNCCLTRPCFEIILQVSWAPQVFGCKILYRLDSGHLTSSEGITGQKMTLQTEQIWQAHSTKITGESASTSTQNIAMSHTNHCYWLHLQSLVYQRQSVAAVLHLPSTTPHLSPPATINNSISQQPTVPCSFTILCRIKLQHLNLMSPSSRAWAYLSR